MGFQSFKASASPTAVLDSRRSSEMVRLLKCSATLRGASHEPVAWRILLCWRKPIAALPQFVFHQLQPEALPAEAGEEGCQVFADLAAVSLGDSLAYALILCSNRSGEK